MARRISTSTETHYTPTMGQSTRLSRSIIEEKMGLQVRDLFNTPLTALINAPTIRCDYYQINSLQTTRSEGIGMVSDDRNATLFTHIKDMVLFQRDPDELEDQPNNEREIQINLAPNQSMILGGTIRPLVGDHIVFYTHKSVLPVPFQVNDVQPKKFIDKDVWQITYAQSKIYTDQSVLEARVVKEMVYVEENVGTGSRVVLDTALNDMINDAESVMMNLQKMYVESFYSKKWSGLYFEPKFEDDLSDVIFHYRSLPQFQYYQQLLKYGYDHNTLFLTNTYEYEREEANYRGSIYETLKRRRFLKRDEIGTEEKEHGSGSVMQWLHRCMEVRDLINDEQELVYRSPKYQYTTKLYFRTWRDHAILTPFINTGKILVELINVVGFQDRSIADTFITYQLKQPYCCQFLDWYMEGTTEAHDAIIRNCVNLDSYYPDRSNIDDYFGIPLLLFVLRETINVKLKDNSPGTYK